MRGFIIISLLLVFERFFFVCMCVVACLVNKQGFKAHNLLASEIDKGINEICNINQLSVNIGDN